MLGLDKMQMRIECKHRWWVHTASLECSPGAE